MKASLILGLALAALPNAFAFASDYSGQGTASKFQPATMNPAGSNMLLPGQILASSEIVGLPCYDANGDRVGVVEAVVRDAHTAEVAAVVIRVRAFLRLDNKNVAVKPSEVVARSNSVAVRYTKRQLQRTVDYRLSYDARYP